MGKNFIWVNGLCLNVNAVLFFSIYSYGGYSVRAHFSQDASNYMDIASFPSYIQADEYIKKITS